MNQTTLPDLTTKQFDTLRLLFRFRFGTSDLIAKAQGGISVQSMRVRLAWLEKRGFVAKRHDGRAKLAGKPAVYNLAAKGRTTLHKADSAKYTERILNTIRANTKPSEAFMTHQLTVFSIFTALHATYGDNLIYLTKSNVVTNKFSYLPKQRPDAFIYLTTTRCYYFLYVLDSNMPLFAHIRRIASLFEYERSSQWTSSMKKAAFPKVLIVTDSNRLATQLGKRLASLGQRQGSEISFETTLRSHVLADHALGHF